MSHIGNPSIRKKFSRLPDHYFGQPSSFGAAATVAAWESGELWLQKVLRYIQGNRDFVYEAFSSTEIDMNLPQATYLAWLNFSETRISQNPSKVILDEAHVALEPGIKFGKQSESYARLNFATSRELLETIVDRVLSVVD